MRKPWTGQKTWSRMAFEKRRRVQIHLEVQREAERDAAYFQRHVLPNLPPIWQLVCAIAPEYDDLGPEDLYGPGIPPN